MKQLQIIKTTLKLSLYFVIFVTAIVLIPNLPPYTKFTSIELTPLQPRVGPLAPNSALNNAERSFKGKFLGPEAFQVSNGELYTSLATGEIVKISPGGHVTFVTKIGQPCTGLVHEHICGRPLGFQIDEAGKFMYVADAYHGIWKVDLKTDKKQLLVSPTAEIEKRTPKLFNSLALGKNGDFYWTDSTSDFHLKDGVLSLFADPSGRLFYYDAAKNTSKVLLDDLWFPNGVVLSPNNDFVVFTETSRFRIMKYYIAGPKKGQSEVFVDGLPGVPDNVRVLPDGSGVLVGLYMVYDEGHPILLRSLSATPAVRKFVARLHRLIEIPFEQLNKLYPHIIFEEIVYYIGHFKSLAAFSPGMAGLLQIDWNGNIVAGYYNTDGTLGHISDAIVYNDKLYTGCPHLQDFLGTVPVPPLLKKAFETTKTAPKVESKPLKAKPVDQPPKPKAEETRKVEQPKTQPKPKVEEKPKVESKPKQEKPVETKPKQEKPKEQKPVETKPKEQPKAPRPVEQVKPKVEEKKEAPKVTKPAASSPKPAQQPKPVEPAKPVEKAAPPAPPPPKPTPPPAKAEPAKVKPVQSQPKPSTPKPEVKTTTAKPTEKPTAPPQKAPPKEPKKEATKVKSEAPKPVENKPKPINEEIPSDTIKPTKESLRVIKKGGPTEIPVPNQ
ncbi:adipocyte plasma membrane-associated protein-like [Trichoplusia ni]|uniref:Adipocyte plasma membrane-associated protein-like n=1 Tax=Trichoplusia ni TaxID=7111 RepID=A0A7E5WYJ3_TRINI|nr:adipocyte plasma membrane-associated protein-like [Trichoplusia ni]